MFAALPWWKRIEDRSEAERGRLIFLACATPLALIVVALASWTTPFRLAESRAFDLLSTIAMPEPGAESPVIVAIDEPSLAEIGRQWPWPRDLHARLVEALRNAGANAIGIDIIFAEPSNAETDAALAAALGPDIVLAADESLIETPHADHLVRTEPLPQFTAGGAVAGIASIALDGDGTQRRVPAYPDGFAARLLDAAGRTRTAEPVHGALLQVLGPARTYPTVSYYQALDPATFLPQGAFEGRTVIVGLSMQAAPQVDAGGADAYETAYTSRSGRLVSGAEIQATIYDNLARGLLIAPVPEWARIASIAAATLLAAVVVVRGTGWRTALWMLAAVSATLAASFLLLRFGSLFIPPLAPSLAFLVVAAAQGARDYAAERRLRRGIVRAFSQYLSPVLVEQLARDPSRLRLGGETRTLTILFADVRGFTTIAESMKDEPEHLTRLVNRLLDPLSKAILEAGGTIDKYIGDCVMAFWNAPLADDDHAANALRAAESMLAALEELNAELAAEAAKTGQAPVVLRLGIGINTGACVVGNMGSETRFDYSALGDAVNLASRLESDTKTRNVPLLIGPETARLLGERNPLVEVGSVQVKGRRQAVTIHTLATFAKPRAKPHPVTPIGPGAPRAA